MGREWEEDGRREGERGRVGGGWEGRERGWEEGGRRVGGGRGGKVGKLILRGTDLL